MYNDTIKTANKIISSNDLFEIFSKMQEKLIQLKRTNDNEEERNKYLDYKQQIWTFKDNGSKLTFEVNFTDSTTINFDNYNDFISAFNNRISEIKYIYVHYSIYYSVQEEGKISEYYHQHINMSIRENKMDIDISLVSNDNKINDIFELIKNKILNSPPKYDKIIQKKNSIYTISGLAAGFLPSITLATLLLFVPAVKQIYIKGYVVYPLAAIILAFLIGDTLVSSKLDKLYKNLNPEQKYSGYDKKNYRSIYKYDIESYKETSEILIGKNANNLKYRNAITEYYEKNKNRLLTEIFILLLISVIIVFL